MTYHFSKNNFKDGRIQFEVKAKPVSLQKKSRKKLHFRNQLNKVTENSEFIIIDTCWISIDYYCPHIRRLKNPNVYDIDNIIKPIIDSLVGLDGLIIDDTIVDRVIVNWIDTHSEDHNFRGQILYYTYLSLLSCKSAKLTKSIIWQSI